MCVLHAKDKGKSLKDLEIVDLERQLRVTSLEQKVCL